jgi:hypothetical protein
LPGRQSWGSAAVERRVVAFDFGLLEQLGLGELAARADTGRGKLNFLSALVRSSIVFSPESAFVTRT